MCGIAGYIVTKPKRIRPGVLQGLSRQLLVEIESRGKDATGYAYVSDEDKHVYMAKAPVEASDFVDIKGHLLSRESVKSMPSVMILHTRFATQGSPAQNNNNHPVYSKLTGLCLVHNGWLLNEEDLVADFSLKKDAEVDTETYLRLIEAFYRRSEIKTVEHGIQEATKLTLGSVSCAMIQGGRPGTLWLWRESGDLAIVGLDWGYVFASTEKAVIEAIYKTCTALDVSWWESFIVPENRLYRMTTSGKIDKFDLSERDWNAIPEKHKGNVSTYTVNGKHKVNRLSRWSGNSYYYGEGNFVDNDKRWEHGFYNQTGKGWHGGHQQTGGTIVVDRRTRASNGNQESVADSNGKQNAEAEKGQDSYGSAFLPHTRDCRCETCAEALGNLESEGWYGG